MNKASPLALVLILFAATANVSAAPISLICTGHVWLWYPDIEVAQHSRQYFPNPKATIERLIEIDPVKRTVRTAMPVGGNGGNWRGPLTSQSDSGFEFSIPLDTYTASPSLPLVSEKVIINRISGELFSMYTGIGKRYMEGRCRAASKKF